MSLWTSRIPELNGNASGKRLTYRLYSTREFVVRIIAIVDVRTYLLIHWQSRMHPDRSFGSCAFDTRQAIGITAGTLYVHADGSERIARLLENF